MCCHPGTGVYKIPASNPFTTEATKSKWLNAKQNAKCNHNSFMLSSCKKCAKFYTQKTRKISVQCTLYISACTKYHGSFGSAFRSPTDWKLRERGSAQSQGKGELRGTSLVIDHM